MSKIFISYRRKDSSDMTESIYKELAYHFGEARLFLDLYDIHGGANFPAEIRKALRQCSIMLVVIGREWLNITDDTGNRRLFMPDDYVNYEIKVGLDYGVTIIPILIDDTGMPHVRELPPELQRLASQQAITIHSHDAHFREDIQKLLARLENLIIGDFSVVQKQLQDLPDKISTHVTSLLKDRLFSFERMMDARLATFASNGIRLVAEKRGSYEGYYDWVEASPAPITLFFAGRSVLHGMADDIRRLKGISIENVIIQKLKEGSRIRILFLDPRSNLIGAVARGDDQALENLVGDIKRTITICKDIYRLLDQEIKKGTHFDHRSHLLIRLYDAIPYFAYHQEGDKIIVGFYPFNALGGTSPAFAIDDENLKRFFSDHFDRILRNSVNTTLLEYSAPRMPNFNNNLYNDLMP